MERTQNAQRPGAVCHLPLLLLALLTCATARGQQAHPAASPLPTLTQAQQARELSPQEANRGYPVHFRAVVTYVDEYALFVQDSSAGIGVVEAGISPQLNPGDLIDLEGITECPDFAPQINHVKVQVLGPAPMPAPKPVGFERLASTAEDSQWIEIEGIGRAVITDRIPIPPTEDVSPAVVIEINGGRVVAHVPRMTEGEAQRLVDSRVRVRGVAGAIYNLKNEWVGARMFVPNRAQFEALEPPPPSPFTIPLKPVSSVLQFNLHGSSGHRIRIEGVVTLYQPGKELFVRDETGSISILTPQTTPVQVGDRVSVAGFPAVDDYKHILDDAVFTKLGAAPPPLPVQVTAKQLFDGDYNSEWVSIEADLLEESRIRSAQTLILEQGGVIFNAALATAAPDRKLRSMRAGSRLRVTGICLVDKDKDARTQSFSILVNGFDDIVIINQPSWWTLKHTFNLLGWVGLFFLAALLWGAALHRQVRRQTTMIGQSRKVMAEVGIALAGAETLRQGLQRCAEILVDNLDIAFARVWVLNDDAKTLELRASAGIYTRLDGDYARIPVGKFKVGRIASSGKPHMTNSVPDDPWVADREWARREGMVAFAGYPLKIDGRVLGVVAAFARNPLPDAAFQVLGSVAESISHFANRKGAEEALRKSDERYRLLFSQMVVGFALMEVIWDENGVPVDHRYLEVNSAFETHAGLRRDAVRGNTIREVMPDIEPFWIETYGKVALTGQSAHFESYAQPLKRWFEVTAFRLRPGQVAVTFANITQRKWAEEEIRASEARYRELFENASDIVYTTDLGMHLTSLNQVGQAALGYSLEEASRLSPEQFVAPEHWQLALNVRKRLMEGETDLTVELELTAKDGRRLMLQIKPRLIYKDGKPVGTQAIARDITGRDKTEAELRHAQKLESVGRLASGIAHEINTPVQFVGDNTRFLQESFGGLQSLLEKYQELRDAAAGGAVSPQLLKAVRDAEEESDCAYLLEEIPKSLQQTLEGVERVATIVRAMKEFAHPEGKSMAAADLNQALLSTLTVARSELKYVADVETELGDLPPLVCNIGDLNQVFLNLFVNAAHAIGERVNGTEQKGVIRVKTAAVGGDILVSVSDTGCGIPEANRTKIFDHFFTTKEVGRGTGQGLAIARSVVVDRHKGALTFESEVGKGTTFHVRLPIHPEESARDSKAA